jgi:hypothetical protein
MITVKRAIGYTLLGSGVSIVLSQPLVLANDYTADLPEVPGLGFTAGAAVGSASLSTFTSVSISDTILDDRQYEVRLERHGGPIPSSRTAYRQK